ncbi:MAG: TetR/AcrR family transcriptional regulator [Burkholderiaceae bacterium]
MPRKTRGRNTAQQVLDSAARLVQTRGFNGFSYAGIAAELGVTKATLHDHFPTKAELGRAPIARYEQESAALLAEIGADVDSGEHDKLRRYVKIDADVLQQDRMCMCGVLGGEHATLTEAMRRGLQHFFDVNESWLARVLERGRRQRQLRFSGSPLDQGRLLVGALESAMMLARSYAEASRFRVATNRLLPQLRPLAMVAARASTPGARGAVAAPGRRTSVKQRA